MGNDLIDYIKNMKSQGHSDDTIKQHLVSNGHAEEDVHKALHHANKHPSNKKFIYIGAVIVLLVVVIAVSFVFVASNQHYEEVDISNYTDVNLRNYLPTLSDFNNDFTTWGGRWKLDSQSGHNINKIPSFWRDEALKEGFIESYSKSYSKLNHTLTVHEVRLGSSGGRQIGISARYSISLYKTNDDAKNKFESTKQFMEEMKEDTVTSDEDGTVTTSKYIFTNNKAIGDFSLSYIKDDTWNASYTSVRNGVKSHPKYTESRELGYIFVKDSFVVSLSCDGKILDGCESLLADKAELILNRIETNYVPDNDNCDPAISFDCVCTNDLDCIDKDNKLMLGNCPDGFCENVFAPWVPEIDDLSGFCDAFVNGCKKSSYTLNKDGISATLTIKGKDGPTCKIKADHHNGGSVESTVGFYFDSMEACLHNAPITFYGAMKNFEKGSITTPTFMTGYSPNEEEVPNFDVWEDMPTCDEIIYHPEVNPNDPTKEDRIKTCLDNNLKYAGLKIEWNKGVMELHWYGNCRENLDDGDWRQQTDLSICS